MKQLALILLSISFASSLAVQWHMPGMNRLRSMMQRSRSIDFDDFDCNDHEFVGREVSDKFMTPADAYPWWFVRLQEMAAPILYCYLVAEKYSLRFVKQYILRQPIPENEPDTQLST